MTIALVTDSTADIPGTIAEDLAIKVIPALLHVGHKTLLDGQDITRERFYDILPSLTPYPTTAVATVGSFAEAYQHALSGAEHVVSVHLSSKLSAVLANARLAAHELDHRRSTSLTLAC